MKIKEITSSGLFDKVVFQDDVSGEICNARAYSGIVAKIVNILRNIGWILTGAWGGCFEEQLIRISYKKKNYHINPCRISFCLNKFEKRSIITSITPSSIHKFITNLDRSKKKTPDQMPSPPTYLVPKPVVDASDLFSPQQPVSATIDSEPSALEDDDKDAKQPSVEDETSQLEVINLVKTSLEKRGAVNLSTKILIKVGKKIILLFFKFCAVASIIIFFISYTSILSPRPD